MASTGLILARGGTNVSNGPTTYHYDGAKAYNTDQLAAEITAAGLPAPSYVNGSGYTGPGTFATSVDIAFAVALTAAQKTTLDGVIASHVPAGPRKARTLLAILTDLNALTAAQKTNVWANFSAGSPPLWATDAGPNAAALFAQLGTVNDVGLTGTALTNARVRAVAFYCQDNWSYLVRPAFDATINVDGSQPA